MLQHNRAFIETVEADRLAAASRRRPLLEGSDLDRVVRAAAAGDAVAWSALLERFSARLRAVTRAHRLATPDAEDVVQTTWLRLFEHIDAVKKPEAVGAWLETTARRESLRLLAGATGERLTDDDELLSKPVDAVAERRLVTAQNRAAVGRALERLPVRQRRLLCLLFADPAPSYQQISEMLGMPTGSLGPTRARGLARLRSDEDLVSAVSDCVE